MATVRKRLAGNKQAAQMYDVESFYLRKLSDLQVIKKYQIEISNRFAALETLNDSEDINKAWENNEQNTKYSAIESLGLFELEQRNPKFDEECLGILDHRKQAKPQWLHDPNQNNIDDMNNERR
jgi:hypothetical protein